MKLRTISYIKMQYSLLFYNIIVVIPFIAPSPKFPSKPYIRRLKEKIKQVKMTKATSTLLRVRHVVDG